MIKFKFIQRHGNKIEGFKIKRYDKKEALLKVKNTRAPLKNLKNTCFMNSVLQCLIHIEEFCLYFLNCETNEKSEITIEMKTILTQIQEYDSRMKDLPSLDLSGFHKILFQKTKNEMVKKRNLFNF